MERERGNGEVGEREGKGGMGVDPTEFGRKSTPLQHTPLVSSGALLRDPKTSSFQL